MTRIDAAGLEFIKSFEGFRAEEYICPGGYSTIGYGHLIRSGAYPNGISESEAEDLLLADTMRAESAIAKLIYVPLTLSQHTALTSFVFNLGAGALQRSTLRRVINRSEHDDVPHELMRWIWAGGRKLPGLIRRRAAEGMMWEG